MKAEDTVMSDEQVGDRMIPSVSPFHSGKLLARAQAEISFKAGIQEVVEWVEANSKEAIAMGATFRSKWQSKLKEWGMSEVKRDSLKGG